MTTTLIRPSASASAAVRWQPGLSSRTWVGVIAGAAVVVRLPFVTQPLGADEGGFLLVASQWAPGRSLYGNYWVDRPPLLVDFFAVADRLGGPVALRVLGALVVGCSVLLAGRIGQVAAPATHPGGRAWTPVATALTAAVFLVNPLFGALEVNGELIALPFVLLGIDLVLRAGRADAPARRSALLLAGGAAGAAALLVKQNELDVFVVLAVAVVNVLRRRGRAVARRDLASALAGATAAATLVLVHAMTMGTNLMGLWTAVITFRIEAAAAISSTASPVTSGRLQNLVLALVVSGAPLLVALFLRHAGTAPAAGALDLRWTVLALLGWESISVLGGGSYWLHYLILLVPGLVLAVAALEVAPGSDTGHQLGRRTASSWTVLSYAALAAAICLGYQGTHLDRSHREDRVVSWLASHARPQDTAVIAYGHPDILQATGLSSPYPELWSLPVRVRDPQLRQLASVLASHARPDWLVMTGSSLATWGLDATTAEAELANHYQHVADIDGHHLYHQRTPAITWSGSYHGGVPPVAAHMTGRSACGHCRWSAEQVIRRTIRCGRVPSQTPSVRRRTY